MVEIPLVQPLQEPATLLIKLLLPPMALWTVGFWLILDEVVGFILGSCGMKYICCFLKP